MGARLVGRRRLLRFVLVGLISCLAAVVIIRPWKESVMTVAVTVMTDDGPRRVVYHASCLLSEDSDDLPLLNAEVNLARWAGKLIRFDVEGQVRRRAMRDTSTGFVACDAELVTPEGTTPVEFTSWQEGRDIGMHTAPLGPLAFRLADDGNDRFAFATKGSLWQCVKVPAGARLRLRLKPVLASKLRGIPQPYTSVAQERPAVPLPARRSSRPPDVFVYVIDALRADHLGCYGYDRGTSPTIDAFAAHATLYENAYTAATWTRPSVATMLSGLYPSVHGSMHWSDGLADWPVLLPEVLEGAGYHTRCFVTNPNLSAPYGLDQGWDEFLFCDAPAQWVTDMVKRALAAEPVGKPVFIYMHTVEPHHPYMPRPEDFKRFDRGIRGSWDGTAKWFERLNVLHPRVQKADLECMSDLYDGKVYEADQGFAGFLAALKQAGRLDNALVILTADHGEAFAEHDTLIHAWDLNQETMRVPLVIRFPQGQYAGTRVRERASLVDLMPTALAQAGLQPDLPYRLPGMDLARLARDPASGPSRRIYGEVARWDSNDVDLVTVIDEDGYKRVIDVSVPPRETAVPESLGLWDIRADPRETRDLSTKLPVRAAYDEQLIASWLIGQRYWRGSTTIARPPRVEHDEVIDRKLKALGYLGGMAQKGKRPGSR
jgi:arylsulfatase A-like enzyme